AGADAGIGFDGPYYSKTTQEIFSAYASDVAYILPNLSVMASLRVDRFSNDNGSQTALSPKFGIVFQPILNKLSVFANYMNGFVNTDPVDNINDGVPNTVSFDPEHADQFEVGVKANLLNNRITGSVSYFNTKVEN